MREAAHMQCDGRKGVEPDLMSLEREGLETNPPPHGNMGGRLFYYVNKRMYANTHTPSARYYYQKFKFDVKINPWLI